MKKSIITVLILFVCFISGCVFVAPESDNFKQNVSTYAKQKGISKRILEMLVNKDSSGLYNMFSIYKRENEDIGDQIDDLFVHYDFSEYDIERVEYNTVNGEQSYRDGRIVFMSLSDIMKNVYDNDDTEYRISYYYIVTDENEPEQEGLVGLDIIRVEDKERFSIG